MNHVSDEVLTSSTYGEVVWNKYRKPFWISSMIARKGGCRWPSTGNACAVSTLGWELVGPGPISSLVGTYIRLGRRLLAATLSSDLNSNRCSSITA